MKLKAGSLLRVPLILLTLGTTAQAVTPPASSLQAFCATVRQDYISEVNRKFQTQHYQGYSKGKGGVGAFGGFGVGGGAEFGYDWQRTWDNFSDTKKQEYQSKNCDEVLRQWGQVSIEEIRTNGKVAIERIRAESDKYSEDTKRIIKQIDFEAEKVHAQTQVRIEELRQVSRLEEAKILAESGERLLKLQEEGQTERLRIETNALVAMNQSNNLVELKKAQLSASVRKQESLTDLFKDGLIGLFELQKEKEITRREIAKLELEIKKLQATATTPTITTATATTPGSINSLLNEWGWSKVACYPNAVFIQLDNDTVCVNPNAAVSAGQYRYDRASNQLIPLALPSAPAAQVPPTPPSTMPVQTTGSPDQGGF